MNNRLENVFVIPVRALFLVVIAAVTVTLADLPRISSGGRTRGEVEVSSASILPESNPMPGTFLLRLRLRNTMPFEQDVTCVAPDAIDGKAKASTMVRLSPGGTAFVTLPLPPVTVHVRTIKLRDSGGDIL